MASVKVILAPPPPKEYHLVLSEKEATALAIILGRVGGPREMSGRKYNEAVLEALECAGLQRPQNHDFFRPSADVLYWNEGEFV